MNAADDWTTMGELFEPHRKARQEKRRSNLESSTALLKERAVPFTSHNDGRHLIVAGRWDLYPSTGKFKERRGIAGQRLRDGRGVLNLLKLIDKEKSNV